MSFRAMRYNDMRIRYALFENTISPYDDRSVNHRALHEKLWNYVRLR